MDWYACIKFLDDNVKYYYVPVMSVFSNKSDNNHIIPTNLLDYDQQQKYYILWTDQNKYPGYIICLGETEEDAKNKAMAKSKRFIIPKKLTSSDTSDQEFEDIKKPPKLKLCKSFAQKQNSERILTKYKSQLLMKDCRDLTFDATNNEPNCTNTGVRILKDVTVKLNDCSGQFLNNSKDSKRIGKARKSFSKQIPLKQTSLSENRSNVLPNLTANKSTTTTAHKTKKAFSQPIFTTQEVVASTSKNVFQYTQQLTTPSLSPQIRTPTINRASEESSHSSRCCTPKSKKLSFRERLERLREVRLLNKDSSETPCRSKSRSESPRRTESVESPHRLVSSRRSNSEDNENPLAEGNVDNPLIEGNVDNLLGEENVENVDNHDETQCSYLYIYKYKLYKTYKNKNFDMHSEIQEDYAKYEVINDKVYLGLGCMVGQKSWRMSRVKKHTSFLRDLGSYIWKKREIPYRCLDLKKIKKSIPGEQPIQLCSPRKLNLYLSLYDDYLKDHKRYKTLTDTERDIMIKDSTETLTALIRDERKALKDKDKN